MTNRFATLAAALLLSAAAVPAFAQPAPQTGYASVNGLEMYYEVRGTGPADRKTSCLPSASILILSPSLNSPCRILIASGS